MPRAPGARQRCEKHPGCRGPSTLAPARRRDAAPAKARQEARALGWAGLGPARPGPLRAPRACALRRRNKKAPDEEAPNAGGREAQSVEGKTRVKREWNAGGSRAVPPESSTALGKRRGALRSQAGRRRFARGAVAGSRDARAASGTCLSGRAWRGKKTVA
jgi:hypothetical protein